MKKLFAVAALSLSALVAGCSAPADESATDTSSTDDALSAAKLAGTYSNTKSEADSLSFYAITFKSNHTYSAIGGCRPNPSGPSCFAISEQSGSWKFTKSGPQLGDPAGAAQIQTTDEFGQKTSYFYTLAGSKLSLSEIFDGKQSVFSKE